MMHNKIYKDESFKNWIPLDYLGCILFNIIIDNNIYIYCLYL